MDITSAISPKVWKSPIEESTSPFKGRDTIPLILDYILEQHGHKEGLGFRKILSKQVVSLNGTQVPIKRLANAYTYITYGEFINRINCLAKGLSAMGVKAGDRVGIYLETRLEWLVCFFAAAKIGAVVVQMYPTLGQQGVLHCLNQPQVTTLFLGLDRMKMIGDSIESLPHLKTIIYIPDVIYSEEGAEVHVEAPDEVLASVECFSLQKVMTKGEGVEEASPYVVKPNDLVMINYTSGTSGPPKGVMATHEAIMQAGVTGWSAFDRFVQIERTISYLPLCHVYEFVITLCVLPFGGKFHLSSPLTLFPKAPGLTPDSVPDIMLAKPTFMVAVPLVLDRFKKSVIMAMKEKGIDIDKLLNGDDPSKYPLDMMKGMMAQMTGGNISYIISGSAPLSKTTEMFWKTVAQIPMRLGYGSTELCGAVSVQDPTTSTEDSLVGTIGFNLLGVKVRLRNWDNYSHLNNEGELLFSYPGISSGYYLMPEETDESYITIDGESYWCSGDIGRIEEAVDGHFAIRCIDRKKELHKLSNGEYVSLSNMESELRSAPVVDQVCITSDSGNQKLIALVNPNRIVLSTMEGVAKERGVSLDQLVTDQVTQTARDGGLKIIPKLVMVCTEDWNPNNGLTTASMKIKRKAINDFYRKKVDLMASSSP